jgi:microcystin-dependent protein
MAKLTRKLKKIFSINTPSDIGVWGSLNQTTSTDPDVIQSTGYETGISAAEVSGKKILPRKDFNGLKYETDYHLAYLYQSGIPEYDATTTYYVGDVVRIVAGGSIYTSKTDNNVGNPLSDIHNWQPDLNGAVPIGSEVGIYLPDADIATYYPNWLLTRGQEVSRTTYPLLFQYLGTTFGAGDGSTTFNLPDTQDRFSVGTGNEYSIGNTGGEKEVALTEAQLAAHDHPVTGSTNTTGDHFHNTGLPQELNAFGFYNPTYGYDSQLTTNLNVALDQNLPGFNPRTSTAGNHNHAVTGTATTTGSGDAHENRPPYLAKSFIIRAY